MNRISFVLLSSLALTGIALAQDKTAPTHSPGSAATKTDDGKMKGSPNAAGFGKSDATAGTAPTDGAASAKATGEDKKNKK